MGEKAVHGLCVCECVFPQAERQLAAREEQKVQSGETGWWGWSTSWVTGATDSEPIITKPPTGEELAKEKEKLYSALGYSERGAATKFSKQVTHSC